MTLSACLSLTSAVVTDPTWLRRGVYRRARRHLLRIEEDAAGAPPAAELATVEGGELHGLIAWVCLRADLRGRGLGLALHKTVAEALGAPLLLDLVQPYCPFDRV